MKHNIGHNISQHNVIDIILDGESIRTARYTTKQHQQKTPAVITASFDRVRSLRAGMAPVLAIRLVDRRRWSQKCRNH